MRRPAALVLVLAAAAPALLAASCQAPVPPPVEIRRDYTPPGDAPCGPFCQGGCYREDSLEAGPCTCGCQAAKPKAPRQVVRAVVRLIGRGALEWVDARLHLLLEAQKPAEGGA